MRKGTDGVPIEEAVMGPPIEEITGTAVPQVPIVGLGIAPTMAMGPTLSPEIAPTMAAGQTPNPDPSEEQVLSMKGLTAPSMIDTKVVRLPHEKGLGPEKVGIPSRSLVELWIFWFYVSLYFSLFSALLLYF